MIEYRYRGFGHDRILVAEQLVHTANISNPPQMAVTKLADQWMVALPHSESPAVLAHWYRRRGKEMKPAESPFHTSMSLDLLRISHIKLIGHWLCQNEMYELDVADSRQLLMWWEQLVEVYYRDGWQLPRKLEDRVWLFFNDRLKFIRDAHAAELVSQLIGLFDANQREPFAAQVDADACHHVIEDWRNFAS